MGDVVNLNRFRKRKAREAAAKVAAANRVKHGRTGAEKARQSQERELQISRHDGHELVTDLEPNDDHEPGDREPDDRELVPEPVGADDSES